MGFHGAELQSDMTMSMLSQGPESRPRMELPGASPIPAFSSTTIITPTSGKYCVWKCMVCVGHRLQCKLV